MRTSHNNKHNWLKEKALSSLPEGEWAVAESQRGMTQDEIKNCTPRSNALKNGHLPEEELSSLPEGEWAVAESQRGMTQDEVKIVCQGATPWKTGTFLKGRVELFTGGWVSFCWVLKRDDAEWSKKLYAKVQRPKKRASS